MLCLQSLFCKFEFMKDNRYSRQIMLPEFGADGQQRLRDAKVLIVGAGGLGSPVALYLAAAGVGTIGIIDGDVVSTSNLQRQVLYKESEVGLPKAECAKRRMKEINSDVSVEAYTAFLTVDNAEQIISQYDVVIDGCDSFATRYLIDDVTHRLRKPYVFGSIGEFDGAVSVFNYGRAGRFADLFPDAEDSSDVKGVLGPVPGVIGTLQAIEAIKVITGCGVPLDGRLLSINLLDMNMTEIEL